MIEVIIEAEVEAVSREIVPFVNIYAVFIVRYDLKHNVRSKFMTAIRLYLTTWPILYLEETRTSHTTHGPSDQNRG